MTKRQITIILLGIIIFATFAFFTFAKKDNLETSKEKILTSSPPSRRANELINVPYHFVSGTADSGTFIVYQGEKMKLIITSDVEETAYLSGYRKRVKVEPGKENIIEFTTTKIGRFELVMKKSGATLGYIDVHPN